jgi:hypothetical protein
MQACNLFVFGSAQTRRQSSVRIRVMRIVHTPIKFFALAATASIISKSLPTVELWRGFTVRKVAAERSADGREWFAIVRLELQTQRSSS